MKRVLLALVIIGCMSTARAQNAVDVNLTADFVSSTVWRGLYLSRAALQSDLTVGWKGLKFSVWGCAVLTDPLCEIDLTLSYTIGGLRLSVVDYWDNSEEARYFYYKPRGTGHSFEGSIEYDFGPVKASWQTFFAGRDYQEADDKRAFSSYVEILVPFRLGGLDWNARAGVVPWASDYYETKSFSLKFVSLKATKSIHITEKFVLPLYGELIATPSSRKLYFVAGFTIKAF